MLSWCFLCFLLGCIWVVSNLYLHLVVIWKSHLLFYASHCLFRQFLFFPYLSSKFLFLFIKAKTISIDSILCNISFTFISPPPLALWPLLMSSESITHIAIPNKLTLCIFSRFYLCFYHSILLSLLHLSLLLYC